MGCHDLGDGTPDHPICAPAIWTGGPVDWWAKALPPLWQYFLPLQKADESIAAPKGHGPPALRIFPCKPAFQGTAGRSHDRLRGPL